MNCSEVVARFTDYLDGRSPADEAAGIEEHLERCSSCVRYRNVLLHGGDVLRSLPEPELREDFDSRLRHRLYHVDDERALSAHGASGAPALSVLAIALVLTAVAWSPTLMGGAPVVELPAIVVDAAPDQRPVRPATATPPGSFSSRQDPELDEGLWANQLIYDYSPLSQRYERRSSVRRVSQLER